MRPPEPARLSLNQITVPTLTLPEAVEACVRHGIGAIAPWRDRVAEIGVDRAARLLRDAGLRVSSLCRGGFLTASSAPARREALRNNRAAIEEAAALGAACLVMVCGPPEGRDLARARDDIARGLEALVPHARATGVRLAVEPLHPMMIGERSAIVTLDEATELAERFDADTVGVIVDAYHVWWDPRLDAAVDRAAGRIAGFHVSDWLSPTTNLLAGRGLMGDGLIDLHGLRDRVERAGYTGLIEVEIISDEHAKDDPDDLIRRVVQRFAEFV
ncbi:sugar phosphate isomerase/epimerase [Actinomadura spongiicola]|uniref:Sugar phosphate isomerase/epimerase n=1 Tax=Actinomadura spongiicola TaxID=2303421 RepID=A0A372GPP8_9ACTN|nr:sugar phosphate isomerase/epimerase family protein [Actinomadura spongiicola]RFS87356.1 sugar phosphate isomerase/epimerase [Actinomadura spongiicola]